MDNVASRRRRIRRSHTLAAAILSTFPFSMSGAATVPTPKTNSARAESQQSAATPSVGALSLLREIRAIDPGLGSLPNLEAPANRSGWNRTRSVGISMSIPSDWAELPAETDETGEVSITCKSPDGDSFIWLIKLVEESAFEVLPRIVESQAQSREAFGKKNILGYGVFGAGDAIVMMRSSIEPSGEGTSTRFVHAYAYPAVRTPNSLAFEIVIGIDSADAERLEGTVAAMLSSLKIDRPSAR